MFSRLRLSGFVVASLSAALLVLTLSAPFVAAKSGGNSISAKLCQKGGYLTLQRSDGTLFATEEDCTSYAAQGGTLVQRTPSVWLTFATNSIPGNCDIRANASDLTPSSTLSGNLRVQFISDASTGFNASFSITTDSFGNAANQTISSADGGGTLQAQATVGSVTSPWATVSC